MARGLQLATNIHSLNGYKIQGRAEVGLLLVVYMLVLLFQIFSIGVAPKSKKFMMV